MTEVNGFKWLLVLKKCLGQGSADMVEDLTLIWHWHQSFVLYRGGETVASYYYSCSYYWFLFCFCCCSSSCSFCSSNSSTASHLSPSIVSSMIYAMTWCHKYDQLNPVTLIMCTFVTLRNYFKTLILWLVWGIVIFWLKLWTFWDLWCGLPGAKPVTKYPKDFLCLKYHT